MELRPRAVLLDMDGLLIDSEPVWARAIDGFCRRRGASYTEADMAVCLGLGIGHNVGYLSQRYRWPLDEAAQVAEILADFAARVPEAPALPHAEALVRSLRGRLPIALASSSLRPLVEAALGGRGWLPWFDAVVTGSDVTHLKPAPEIYLEAAHRLGCPPADCLVLEDSQPGCRAGRAAGMTVVAVPAAAERAAFADLADWVAPDLAAVAAALGL